jgi:hypothetical protein
MNRRDFIRAAAVIAGTAPAARLNAAGRSSSGGDGIDYARRLPAKVRTDVMIAGEIAIFEIVE